MTSTVTIGPADAPIASLYLGDAYTIRPQLGWMDADVLDPPYLFDNSGGGAFRKARGASDQLPVLVPYLNGLFHRFVLLGWIKPNPSPMANKHYLADVEPFIHAWNPGYHPQGDHHDKHRWITSSSMPSKVWSHPTVKPAAVMDKIARNVAGSTICDPFMGSGSTGVAAIKAGKRFVGIEQNPRHFETAVRRISDAWAAVQEQQAD